MSKAHSFLIVVPGLLLDLNAPHTCLSILHFCWDAYFKYRHRVDAALGGIFIHLYYVLLTVIYENKHYLRKEEEKGFLL